MSHLSLHFDGIRVDRFRVKDSASFARASEQHILTKTGFRVTIAEKQHLTLFEACKKRTIHARDVDTQDQLLKKGNCIPCAVAHLLGSSNEVLSRLRNKTAENLAAQSRGARKYGQWTGTGLGHLVPCEGMPAELSGRYLLHAENGGSPHCVALWCAEDGTCHLIDGKTRHTVTSGILNECFLEAVDRDSVVFFQFSDDTQTEVGAAAQVLFDLLAGARRQEEEEEASVHVSKDLEVLLRREVDNVLKTIRVQKGGLRVKKGRGRRRGAQAACSKKRCVMCPFRSFRGGQRLRHHVISYHDQKHRFCASGTKQLRVVVALFDNDIVTGQAKTSKYLQRSAEILQQDVRPCLSPSQTLIDKLIRLIVDKNGPRMINRSQIGTSIALRRVGNVYYTLDLAEAVFKAAVLSRTQFRGVGTTLLLKCQETGSELSSLLPNPKGLWWHGMLEDIFYSQPVLTMTRDLLSECEHHDEYSRISMDGTVKCVASPVGQATYRTPRSIRDTFPTPESECIYRVLSIRGRTGAVVALAPVFSEAVEHVVTAILENLTESQRRQVLSEPIHAVAGAEYASIIRTIV